MSSDDELSQDEENTPHENGENSAFEMAARGNGPNTGPKGVIADYKDYQRQKAEERRTRVERIMADANRFSLNERAEDRDKNGEEDSDDLDSDDEEFMRRYRERRIEEMAAFAQKAQARYGRVEPVTPGNFVEFVDDVSPDTPVIIHLLREEVYECRIMSQHLRTLAARYPIVKFGEAKARDLSAKFNSDAGLPALLVYIAGELAHNLVGITDDLGLDFSREDVELFLARRHVLPSAIASVAPLPPRDAAPDDDDE